MSQAADIGSMLQRAQRAFHDGRMGIVESECRQVLETAPDNAEAWVLMATVARHYGRLEDATEMMRRAVQLKPDNLHMKEVLASIYLARRDWRNAEALYERLIVDTPAPRYVNALAKCAWGVGRYAPAVERFRQAAEEAPGDPALQVGLAQAYLSMWRFEDADRVLSEFLERDPGHSAPWMLLARLRLDDADPAPALELGRRAANCEDANALVHLTCAALERLAGNERAASDRRLRVPEGTQFDSMWEGFEYGLSQRPPAVFSGSGDRVLERVLGIVEGRGANIEVGVFHGRTLRHIASRLGDEIHGFDDLSALPDDPTERARDRSLAAMARKSEMPPNVSLQEGPYDRTLPEFLQRLGQPVRFAHVNLQEYAPTRSVLEGLVPWLRAGSVLVFRDFVGYPGWRERAFGALQEAMADAGMEYRYLGFGLLERCTALQITGD